MKCHNFLHFVMAFLKLFLIYKSLYIVFPIIKKTLLYAQTNVGGGVVEDTIKSDLKMLRHNSAPKNAETYISGKFAFHKLRIKEI